jgi:MFS family permease
MPTSPQATSAAPSLAPFKDLLRFAFFNATTWMISLGTPLVLLAGQLGASAVEVGLVHSFILLLLPVQILSTLTLPRFGYKRQVIFGWSTRAIFLTIPLGLALLAPEEPQRWMVLALVASTFFFSFFRSLGSSGIMPLVYGIVPAKVQGRYFSTDQAATGIAGIMTLVFCALLFRYLPTYSAFSWLYAYAIVGAALSVFFLSRVKDPPKPTKTSLGAIILEVPRLCLRASPFRQYLGFMVTFSLMGTAFVPLQAYYLKVEENLGIDRILLYTALQYVGAIAGTLVMRNRIDRIGVKPVFRISLTAGALICLYWYFLVTGSTFLLTFLPLTYFVFGIQTSQWFTAQLKYLPRVCDPKKQALHVSIFSALSGLVGGIAPILWGFIVRVPGQLPGVDRQAFAIFFLCLLTANTLLFLYVPKLTSENRDRPALLTGAALLRPFRYMGNFANALPTAAKSSKQEQPEDSNRSSG